MGNVIKHIVKKEFIQIRKDKRMLAISLISPIVQLLLLGYAANIDIKNIPIVICGYDSSRVSREYTGTLVNSGYFDVIRHIENENDIDGFIDDGKASVGVVIPRNFGNDITAGKTVMIQSIVDGSDSNSATIRRRIGFEFGYDRHELSRHDNFRLFTEICHKKNRKAEKYEY